MCVEIEIEFWIKIQIIIFDPQYIFEELAKHYVMQCECSFLYLMKDDQKIIKITEVLVLGLNL